MDRFTDVLIKITTLVLWLFMLMVASSVLYSVVIMFKVGLS